MTGALFPTAPIPLAAQISEVECVVPQGSICVDAIDHRLLIQ